MHRLGVDYFEVRADPAVLIIFARVPRDPHRSTISTWSSFLSEAWNLVAEGQVL